MGIQLACESPDPLQPLRRRRRGTSLGSVAAFDRVANALGIAHTAMPSGAGHDAAVFAGAGIPTLMVFVRNQNGSHNPDEAMRMEDFDAAVRLIGYAVANLT